MQLEKFRKNISPSLVKKRKNSIFLRMLPYAAAGIISLHALPSFSQGMDTVLARGKEIRVVCGKDTTSLVLDADMKEKFGLDSIPEKHRMASNTYSSGFKEYYILAKGAKGVIVVYWSPESEEYAAQIADLGKDASAVGSAIVRFGRGLVAVKNRSILLSNEDGIYAVDLDSAAQKYGEIGDILMYAPKSGMLHIYPIGWLGKAWLLVDLENAAVRVKMMKIKVKRAAPQLIDI